MATAMIIVGAAIMGVGVFMLLQWTAGTPRWLDAGVLDRRGESKNERQFIDLYFLALVIAPLLGGSILILMGLARLL